MNIDTWELEAQAEKAAVKERRRSSSTKARSIEVFGSGIESEFVSKYMLYTALQVIKSKATDVKILDSRGEDDIEIDYGVTDTVITQGVTAYVIDGQIIVVQSNFHSSNTFSVSGNGDISGLLKEIHENILNNNPLVGKNVIFDEEHSSDGVLKKPKKVSYKEVVMDSKMKENIIDEVVYNLTDMDSNNGILLHGKPGVGKTLISSALANDLNKRGITTLVFSAVPNFTALRDLIKYLCPKVGIFFEDIDGYAQDRSGSGTNADISGFLQFLNGLGEQTSQMSVVATTNYLEQLDDAIKNRPVRFNRKYEFNYPNEAEVTLLLKNYFKDELDVKLIEAHSAELVSSKFTGAFISDLKRTSTQLALKKKKKISDVFPDAIQILKEHFPTSN